ncbi:MAG: glycosyltransferase family 9 protein [Deltaproteobacteria bacterium]|nr:glycosyltransferase family 9 protein [Deltaproteobacteria bacterium]
MFGQLPKSLPPIHRILLIQPSRIGDIVFSLPTLRALRRTFPQSRITWLVDDRCRELVEGHPDLDETLVVPFKMLEKDLKDREWKKVWRTVAGLKRTLRAGSFDLSLDLHGLAKSALLVWLAGARLRLGSANTNGMKEFSGFFSREIPAGPEDRHTVERNLAVIRYLGGETTRPEFDLPVSGEAQREVREILSQAGCGEEDRLIVIHPGAGWLSRRWPADRYAALIQRLHRDLPAKIAVIGGPEGGSKEDHLFQELFSRLEVPVINLVRRLGLQALLALFKRAQLFIGNEAGPMHLANALGLPAVVLIGPTIPERTGPFGTTARVIRQMVGCNPCRERNCPDLKCLAAIEVSQVEEAAHSLWKLHCGPAH